MSMVGTSLTNRIPARLTVAGVAFLRELISKIIRMAAVSGIRSFDTSVSTCSRAKFQVSRDRRQGSQFQNVEVYGTTATSRAAFTLTLLAGCPKVGF